MKPAFEIVVAENKDSLSNCLLVLELGDRFLTFAWLDQPGKSINQLRQYHLNTGSAIAPEQLLMEIVENDPDLQNGFKEAIVIYNNGTGNFVPEAAYSAEHARLFNELVNGTALRGLVLSEKIPDAPIYTIYRVGRELHAQIQRQFPAGKYWHYFSLLVAQRLRAGLPEGDLLDLYFYPDQFTLAFYRNGGLLLIQRYEYQVPEDVAYQALRVCQQWNADPETLKLSVSGLIDADSALYDEIARYFLHIDWNSIPLQEVNPQYPSHYFSPLLQMLLCV